VIAVGCRFLGRFLQSFILNENPNYSYTVVDPMLPPSEGGKSIFDKLHATADD
jgi:hypothetical protein